MLEWREEIKNHENFRRFYFWIFDYLKQQGKTILSTYLSSSSLYRVFIYILFFLVLEEATTVWAMLGLDKQWALWPKFHEYLEAAKTKSISKVDSRFIDGVLVHLNTQPLLPTRTPGGSLLTL